MHTVGLPQVTTRAYLLNSHGSLRKCWFNVGSKLEIAGQRLISAGVTLRVIWAGDYGQRYCYTSTLLVISRTVPIIVFNSRRVQTCLYGTQIKKNCTS